MPFESVNNRFGNTFDIHNEKSPAQFDLSEGVHTIEIAGRSRGLILDQVQLGQSGVGRNGLEFSELTEVSAPRPAPRPEPQPTPEPQQNRRHHQRL